MSKPKPFNWQQIHPRAGGVIELDAVPVVDGNDHVVTRGKFKIAAWGREQGTFAVLDRSEVKQLHARLTAWLDATYDNG